MSTRLTRLSSRVPSLRAALILIGPDGLVSDRWRRAGEPLPLASLADACRALLSGRRQSLPVMSEVPGRSVLLLEADDLRVVLTDLSADAVAAFVFDGEQPLGLVNAMVRELSGELGGGRV